MYFFRTKGIPTSLTVFFEITGGEIFVHDDLKAVHTKT
jgi:hypothetical protein